MKACKIRYTFFIALAICGLLTQADGQSYNARPVKTFNVADGLPQSFISGLVQDSTGFIWTGTRDGLARYDGKKFKIFSHTPATAPRFQVI